MKTIIKKTRELGTSAGVILPKAWLNKKVAVVLEEKNEEIILKEVIEILIKKGLIKDVKGVYLIGSYARGDFDFNSDIDVLVITNNISKIINYEDYEIVLINEKDFARNLESNLYRLVSVNEARTLINKELILKYKHVKPRININKFVNNVKRVIKINKGFLDDLSGNEKVPDAIVYSVVLRLREIYFLRCLLNNNKISKKAFLKFTGTKAYEAYTRVKRNEKEIKDLTLNEALNLCKLAEKWLREIRN